MSTERAALEPLPARPDLPALEADVLRLWEEQDVFARSLAATAGGPLWTFYEGPPTANGKPGTHHVEARVFKDLFPRYRTMKGYRVPRRAGWDCHGLPVEIAVEKELGLDGKPDVERYGVAAFNERCRESVQRHVGEFERLTRRMGYWVDTAEAYWTMDAAYVESVWWSLAELFDTGLLVEDVRVAPYCPRCGTGLSDHEVAQGYRTVEDPSVYVRFPALSGPAADLGAALLVWTTTPWTLVSNTAVAVAPDVDYVAVRAATGPGGGSEALVVAEPLAEHLLGSDGPLDVLGRWPGRDLVGTSYARPFDLVDVAGDGVSTVLPADYVTTQDGTGLVHQAPAFGAEDLALCRRYGLPVVNPVGADGRFSPDVDLVGSTFFKDADPVLTADLQARGLLWRGSTYSHSYPHCWRCDTALIYYALPSWYVRTTARKAELLEQNAATDWHPEAVRDGRYGDWLENNVDWALSRDRYWGTPLPLWRCTADPGHLVAVRSRAHLSELAGRDLSGLDPHRPFVDEVVLPCPLPGDDGRGGGTTGGTTGGTCGAESRRVPPVVDAWYDSGAMPFAQWGAPHQRQEEFEAQFPAQYICEAVDQTRGWFYTLMAVSTLVLGRSSYETVLCLGHIVDEQGKKMSKHLGNVLDPHELFDTHGADAVRWLMLATGNPWASRRVGHGLLEDVVRRLLMTWWSTASFFALYAGTASWTPSDADPGAADRPVLDRWVLSELSATAAEVDEALKGFDSVRAGRRLATFLDDLSNWYVRRSRRRFWDGDPAALATLHTCLEVFGRLMAPFTPFLAETLHQRLVRPLVPDAPVSVHLTSFPRTTGEPGLLAADARLSSQVALVRRLVDLGRSARTGSGVRTRQPLARALVSAPGWGGLPPELRREVAQELNVREVAEVDGGAGDLVDVIAKVDYRAVGRRFGRRTPAVADAVAAANARALAAALRDGGIAQVDVGGEAVTLGPDELVVSETPRTGWAVASDATETVALDTALDDDLRRDGRARDVVRLVQEARKSSGLDVSDRVEVWWEASDGLTGDALREHGAAVSDEVLAVRWDEGAPVADVAVHEHPDVGLRVWLRRAGA